MHIETACIDVVTVAVTDSESENLPATLTNKGQIDTVTVTE